MAGSDKTPRRSGRAVGGALLAAIAASLGAPGCALRWCVFNDGGCAVSPDGRVDIRERGARCDGTTDDTIAVQSALDVVPEGGTVVVSCAANIGQTGVTMRNKRNVTVRAEGSGSGLRSLVVAALDAGAGGAAPPLFALAQCSGCAVRELRIDGAGQPRALLDVQSGDHVTVANNALVGVASVALHLGALTDVEVSGNQVDGASGDGLVLEPPPDMEVHGFGFLRNRVTGLAGNGLRITASSSVVINGVNIAGNQFVANGYGVWIEETGGVVEPTVALAPDNCFANNRVATLHDSRPEGRAIAPPPGSPSCPP